MTQLFLTTAIPTFSKKDDVTAVALKLGALALILCSVALPVPTAWAVPTDYVISGAATTTNGGATLSTGDTMTITATGSVTTSGISGLETTVGGTTIIHNGPIITTGNYAYGIVAGTSLLPLNGSVTILGMGNISTVGIAAWGIYSDVTSGNAIITAGDVSTTGFLAYGIFSGVTDGNATFSLGDVATTNYQAIGIYSFVTNGDATITAGDVSTTGFVASGIYSDVTNGNAIISVGDISTQGFRAYGIYSVVANGNATITAGNISTTGIDAHGITGGASNLSIVNDHSIAVSGMGADGINLTSFNDHVRIVNTGTISSAQSYGIYVDGNGTIITNSGMISGSAGAVQFKDYNFFYSNIGSAGPLRLAGTGNTLSLLAGSKIVGLLDIAGEGGNTLSIGKRLNTALAYTYSPTLTVETNGMPYALAYVGNYRVLAVVDPTLFAAEDDMVADLSRSVGNAIDARLGSAVGQSGNTIMASTSNALPTGPQWDTWATGLASYREQGKRV